MSFDIVVRYQCFTEDSLQKITWGECYFFSQLESTQIRSLGQEYLSHQSTKLLFMTSLSSCVTTASLPRNWIRYMWKLYARSSELFRCFIGAEEGCQKDLWKDFITTKIFKENIWKVKKSLIDNLKALTATALWRFQVLRRDRWLVHHEISNIIRSALHKKTASS
jgi:hypothetical protein